MSQVCDMTSDLLHLGATQESVCVCVCVERERQEQESWGGRREQNKRNKY